ncbi:DUF6177 family protein [Kribbella sp. NPDC023855]|uniref:DUF6177 family protein n=1 Tax=Kribbella sp. NPDC023855 TaxID=3154698 RepID=UPI00340AD686
MSEAQVELPLNLYPGVDQVSDEVVLVMQDRPVVGLSSWLQNVTTQATRNVMPLQLVTPKSTRLTFAARMRLFNVVGSRWVVVDGEETYDGLNGSRLKWDGQKFAPRAEPVASAEPSEQVDWSPAYVDTTIDLRAQLLITARFQHEPLEMTVVGGATGRLVEALTGEPPAGWGTAEPATQPWRLEQLSDFCRGRMPTPSWLSVAGGVASGTKHLGAHLEINHRPAGLEETITVCVAQPGRVIDNVNALGDVVDRLADEFELVTFFAQLTMGTPEGFTPPHFTGFPAPIGLALGNDGLQALGVDRALDMSQVGAIEPVLVGPQAAPSAWYPLGDGLTQSDWRKYSALVDYLNPSA